MKQSQRSGSETSQIESSKDEGKKEVTIFAENRKCRDVLCSLIFIAFIGGTAYLAFYAYQKDADPRRVIMGYDKFGNTCGRKNEPIKDAPFSGQDVSDYLFHYTEKGFSICVKECPSIALSSVSDLTTLFDQGIKMCEYGTAKADYAFDGGVKCAVKDSLPTEPFIFDCTQVTLGSEFYDEIFDSKDFSQKIVADMYVSRKIIITLVALSIPVCFIWICILNYIAPIMIYTLLTSVFIGSIGASTFMWLAYRGHFNIREALVTHRTLWAVGSVLATIITVILCLLILAMLKRVQIAVSMLNEASKFLNAVPLIIFQPAVSIIIFLAAFLVSIIIFLALVTPHIAEVDSDGFVTYKT